ncbi:MAG: MaoC family dehydratase [Candidatus Competibacter sp.]|nr:MaoC family dehydratase [Candidatus Competibacter sp.]MDG4585231.1 MaoC family dehydratase [Candidatus Competibacter sp.]
MYPTHEGYNDTLHGYYLEDLRVGMSASHAKTVTETDVVLFAGLTGDNNPIHCNDVFATQTPFKSRIVHGMFCAGLISCVAGTRLPGPGCVYVEQQLRFKAPVRIGDTVTAVCAIQEIVPERRRVIMRTTCTVQDKVVVEGSATFVVNRRGS